MIDNKYSQISLNKPFSIMAYSIGDKLATEPNSRNSDNFHSEFVIGRISSPHCFPQSYNVTAGQTFNIDAEGLNQNSVIHGLIGPTTVNSGQTDNKGSATIQLPIPLNISTGLHSITIGVDKTALTA